MNLYEAIPLFGIMVALAAVPSASVVLVVTRSATLGVANGIAVSAGIVLGDLVFLGLAILGLAAAAEAMGSLFVFLKVMAGLYLLWLGFRCCGKAVAPRSCRVMSMARADCLPVSSPASS